jgi:EmrB/QacA subfamily drug resistance transporter
VDIANINKKRKMLLLIGVGLGTLLAASDATVVTTAMPKIIAELNGLEQYTWPMVSYLLCITIAMPPVGKLTDTLGSKTVYLFGIISFLVGSALCGTAQNMPLLALYRGVQGVGGAILISNALVIVGLLFAPAERAKYVGIVGSASALATIAGPALGGYITDSLGWQWVFFINLPVGLLALIVILFVFPKEKPSFDKKGMDWRGALLLVVAPASLLFAVTQVRSIDDWTSPRNIVLLVVSAATWIAFFLIERKVMEPIMPLSMFRVSVFGHAIVGMFLVNAALMGANIYIPLLVQDVLGASASKSGVLPFS